MQRLRKDILVHFSVCVFNTVKANFEVFLVIYKLEIAEYPPNNFFTAILTGLMEVLNACISGDTTVF